MNRRLPMLAVSILLITSLGTGCIGNFALVSKVRKFNLEVSEDRWGRELVFVCLYIIPAYPVSGVLDLIIFNAIEFWSGKNPIDGSKSVSPISMKEWTTDEGTKVAMQRLPDNSIDVNLTSPNGEKRCFNLIRTDEGVTARDEAGNAIVSSTDLTLEQLEDHI